MTQTTTTQRQIAFVDTRLANADQIAQLLSAAAMPVVLLDAASDGLAGIAQAVALARAEAGGFDAIHIFSHGSPGSVQLGAGYLDIGSLATAESQGELASIGAALNPAGSLLLYGCDIGRGDAGQQFVKSLVQSVHARVAASSDATGSANLGGDWDLELVMSPDGSALVQAAATLAGVPVIDLLSEYSGLLSGTTAATAIVQINTGHDYLATPTPGTTPLTVLGAVELGDGKRVVLLANARGDYYGMANLDYLQIALVDGTGTVSTTVLTGTVANVVNDNASTPHNASSTLQTNDGASIVALKNGGFVVASLSNDGYGIALYDNAGTVVPMTAPAAYTSTAQVNPDLSVAATSDGGFVLLWTLNNYATVNFQRYTSAGVASGATVSTAFTTTDSPYIDGTAVDASGNIAIPVGTTDAFTLSKVKLWNPANGLIGTYSTAYYQAPAVIAPRSSGGFALFGNDIASGAGNTSNSYFVQDLATDGTLGTPVAGVIPVAYLTSVSLAAVGNYLAVGGSDATAHTGYFVDGTSPAAGTTYQITPAGDDAKLATTPTIGRLSNVVAVWLTSATSTVNEVVTDGTVSVVTYAGVFNLPPAVTTPTAIVLTDTAAADTFSNTTGTLSATDADGISTYGIDTGTSGGSNLIGADTYDVSKSGSYGTLYVKSSNGAYVFVPNASAVDALASGTPSDTFTVTATDSNDNPATGSAALTVNVTGANDTPTDITLSSNLINQSAGINATVGTLGTLDAESSQTHTYTLITGDGTNDNGNALFSVSSGTLRANNAGALTAGSYNLYLRSTDNGTGALFVEKALTVTVMDDVAPIVADIVRVTPSNATTNADTLVYQVTFNEAVANVDSTDFSVSGTTGSVSNVSAVSGEVYEITVSGGDLAGYNGTATLSFAAAQNIVDTATAPNALTATTPIGTNNSSYTLDNTAPILTTVSIASNNATSTLAKVGDIVTLTFSADGTLSGTPTAIINGNAATVTADGGNDYTATYQLTGSDTAGAVNFSISASDAAGNAMTPVSSVTNSSAVTFDKTAPTLSAVTRPTLSGPTGSSTFTIDVAYADIGTGLDATSITTADITVTGSNTVGTLTVSGVSFSAGVATYTVNAPGGGWNAATQAGNYTVALVAGEVNDLAGNSVAANASAHSFAVSFNSAPAITSNGAGATASLNMAENTTAVTTVTATDADLDNLIFSITGGADQAKLSLNNSTGALSFVSAPNFESPSDSDANNRYDVVIMVSDGRGGSDSQSLSITVTNANDAPTGVVTISGKTTVGETLAAANTLSDADGPATLAVSYQWMANDVAISGATSSILVLGADQLDKTITVIAGYTDAGGTPERVSSAATAAIANVANSASALTLSGVLTDSRILENTDTTSHIRVADIVITGDNQDSNTLRLIGVDATKFEIVGTALYLKAGVILDFETQESYELTVQIIDPALPTSILASASFTLYLVNVAEGTTVTPLPEHVPALPPLAEWPSLSDQDGDGVPDTLENFVKPLDVIGAVIGDGNGDGIADALQQSVASLPFLKTPAAISSPSDAPYVFNTLVADSLDGKPDRTDSNSTLLQNVVQKDAPASLPEGIEMPLGMISFNVVVGSSGIAGIGVTESFSLYVDSTLAVNGYWNLDASKTWVNLASIVYGGAIVTEAGKTRLDFKITDGGEFDADHNLNGTIADVGAAGYVPLSLVGYAPELPAGGFWF